MRKGRPRRRLLKMDNRDICNLKEKKMMDANTVWQWRVMRVKKCLRRPQPFHYCNKIGLDFNVSSNTQKKLDLQLVTNGVILEVCDFAKTVKESKKHFITNILENNFDLGFENEQQRIDFTAQILHKVKDLIRKPPKDKHEVFTLFDTSCKPEFNSNIGLNMEHKTESFLVEMDDTDDSEHEDEFKCSQATSKEYTKTESLSEEMDRAHGDGSEHEDELKCSGVTQSTEQLKEDILPPSFPYCEEIGLSLDVGSKQSLDPRLLTKGVMLELVHFTRVLTASYSPIVLGVLEHNFELDLKSQQVKNRIWFKISHLLNKRKRLTTTGSKITPEFKNEPFSFQTNPIKRPKGSALSNMGASQYQFKGVIKRRQSDLKNKQEKRAHLTTSERVTKRRRTGQSTNMETDTQSHHTDLCTSGTAEGGHCYTCSIGESDLDSDKVTNSRNSGSQDRLHNPTCSDIPRESESSCLGICAPFLTSTDVSSTLPTVNSNVNPPFASQPDKKGFGEEQTQTPRNAPNECDMEQEEMGTENSMWKLRANRVQQILSPLNKEFGPFNKSKKVGLEFNVGFGPKQNISVDSLTNCVLLELTKFALAMNSSQQYFIMEILEYNFDFGRQSQRRRNTFTCEIMNGVRQLTSCEDAVKFSNEVFELPAFMPSIKMANQSMGSDNPELSSMSIMEECDVAPTCPPHSHAETKEPISWKSEDLYPFCKEIGLKLHVNNSQPNKKLDINKLTNGAMAEVTNFAEKLCGTFEQICLDILRHNLDLDLQSGDSELARNVLARIPALMERRNLLSCVKPWIKLKGTRNNIASVTKVDCQNNPNVDASGAGSSQAAIIDQNVGSSPDTEHQNEVNLKMWKLRANHIQQILSIPHVEHCPLYSYSRSKKSGIDFNVGSGVKLNLDPKLLTNGIMVEINTFAKALQSATKHFVTEILEYNFNLNLKNELDRSAFTQQTWNKIYASALHKRYSILKMPFELPDMRCIQEPTYDKATHCPKCYQDRNHKLRQDESDLGHMQHPRPHTLTDTVSADANCTAQKPAKDPSSTISTIEETIMDSYPRCKEIGLNLCVDKDQPKDKLDTGLLTRGIMNEVASFAKKLCGTKSAIINAVLEHNFNTGMQNQSVDLVQLFRRATADKDGGLAWFSEVFVIQPCSHREPGHVSKVKRESAMQTCERKETIKKRKLTLQTKEEKATLPSQSISDVKSKTKHRTCYPICKEIGLDLDVTSKSAEKEKLDLQLLTRAVVLEIHKFATQKKGHFFPRTVYDILDYNFDLSSQHHRRLEFSMATASKVQTMVKQYRKTRDRADEVFKLPFFRSPKASQRLLEKRQNTKSANYFLDIASESESSYLAIRAPVLTSTNVSSSLPTVNSNVYPPFASQPDKRGLCGGEERTQTPRNAPNECDMEQEEMETENNYTCPLGESDLDSDEVTDLGNAGNQDNLQIPKSFSLSPDIPRESESSCLGICAPFLTSTDVSSTLPTVNSNVNPPFASHPDKRGLCGGEERTQTPRNAPNECDMEQEEMGTENKMWKLRANRVQQILSPLNKEFGPFNKSKKVGLEFNVGFGSKQNISVDSLTNCVLLELTKFALAMNSSQQYFIMEILEYNFDFGRQSQRRRNTFTCEIMNRVRQLTSCEDAVKFSNEVFELPAFMPSIKMANQSMGSDNPELSSMSIMEECDVAPTCPPHSHAETKEPMSWKSEDLYPFCKEIGLKLHVNNSQSNKKLDINKLTNGAMAEVTNFAEKLCGTFEQICLDILRHNLDLDLQSGDSELARNVLARIPALMEQRNLLSCVKPWMKLKGTRNKTASVTKVDCQNNPNVDASAAGSSRAAIIDQNVGSSPDTEHQNEVNLKMWKLRANHIQQILSIPHVEHCPLYSYSRSKKSGIDFNVGSGVKLNLDPKLLTNGIMVEINTFAKALQSATKHFVTEILEYNFNLNLKNELDRSAFTQQTWNKIRALTLRKRHSTRLMKMPFELPDMRCIQEPTYDKATHCPKCYQDRNHKLRQDESDPGHTQHPRPHTMTDTVSADANCTAQKPAKDPSSTISTIEETIMDSYPRCKKIGLNLCVDKDQPKDKLDTGLLTHGIMNEVASFAKKLCGRKCVIINAVLEHNFNTGMQNQSVDLVQLFRRATADKDGGLAWFSEVYVIQPCSHREPGHVSKVKRESAMRTCERKETIKKRKLALQTKEEKATLPSQSISEVKSKTKHRTCYPICKEIGLDLDVTSKSAEKEKLDLQLLTRAVVLEIHKFAIKRLGHSFPRTVYDILDYNFDLSSQHHRCLEFSMATAIKVSTMVKRYCKTRDRADEVFKLPFFRSPKASQRLLEKKQNTKSANYFLDIASESESSCLATRAPVLTSTNVSSSLPTVTSNVNPPFASQPDKKGLCGGGKQKQTPRNAPNECDMEQEEMETENNYTCPLGESDLDSDEVTDSGNAGNQDNLQIPKSFSLSPDIPRESESSCLGICAPFLTSTDVSSTLPTVNSNVNPPFASHPDKRGLCGGEQQTQTPRNAPNECDMEQEEMGTENKMWKLRANRVQQILSPLNKEFGPFNKSKKVGLEFNVGFGPKQNISVDSLTNCVLLELTKFALAMNSSQQYFIMEILEYNFDFGRQSQRRRNTFTCEIMNGVRQLTSCEDAVKFSNEVFELPAFMPSIKMANQSMGSDNPELSSMSIMEECDVAPTCPPHSHAETKEPISWKSEDLYPFCKEIGLKLHVNNSQSNKKLDINKLTNGAMAEVTNFAEKLCGTFEQICLDILRHNLDLDLQSGDSELDRSILARIPALMERRNLLSCVKPWMKLKGTRNKIASVTKVDCQNNPNVDASAAGSSQAAIIDQNVGSSPDTEHQNEVNLKMWKLRANHIQQILSIPHVEHCPLYSYSRSKKSGIDFNVGSGVKLNLDPKLLTNGIMVEINTFAKALQSATKHFVTEILEYNFNLNLKNELDRNAFTQQTWNKIRALTLRKRHSTRLMKMPFELPDMRCIQEPTYDKATHCPKCYQDRNHKLRQDESDLGHMQHPRPYTMTDTVSADANCTAQKPAKDPSSTISTIEETIMDSYPRCKKIGLNLCVDKDQPKDKLDTGLLTHGIMNEVASFAKKLCGRKCVIINAVLEHNFNTGMQNQSVDLVQLFRRATADKDGGLAWFSEVFVIQPCSHREPGHVSKVKRESAMRTCERKETIKKRKLALQTKEEKATLPSQSISDVKSKTKHRTCYPNCAEIGLDLEKRQNKKCKKYTWEELDEKINKASFVHLVRCHSESSTDPGTMVQMNGRLGSVGCGSLWGNMQIKEEEYNPHYGDMKQELENVEKYHPHYDDVKTESNIEDVEHLVPGEPAGSLQYNFITMCPNPESNIKTASENEVVNYYILAEPQGSEGHAMLAVCPNTEGNITELEIEGVKYLVPVEAAASQGYSMITIGQGNESALIKEEQENMPADSYHDGVVSYTASEVDIKQE